MDIEMIGLRFNRNKKEDQKTLRIIDKHTSPGRRNAELKEAIAIGLPLLVQGRNGAKAKSDETSETTKSEGTKSEEKSSN